MEVRNEDVLRLADRGHRNFLASMCKLVAAGREGDEYTKIASALDTRSGMVVSGPR
jgi:hypothetical protein